MLDVNKPVYLEIRRDSECPFIFRAVLSENGESEIEQILPCTFLGEPEKDVLHFFEILQDFLNRGGNLMGQRPLKTGGG
jgi:hypothetical protein